MGWSLKGRFTCTTFYIRQVALSEKKYSHKSTGWECGFGKTPDQTKPNQTKPNQIQNRPKQTKTNKQMIHLIIPQTFALLASLVLWCCYSCNKYFIIWTNLCTILRFELENLNHTIFFTEMIKAKEESYLNYTKRT